MSVYYITNKSIDNFNSIGQLEYVGIENKVLTEKEIQDQNKVELYKDTTIFINDFPFNGYPIRIGTTIRPATVVELIKLNLQDLKDGEYIEGDELKEVQKPSYRHNIWDKNTRTWLLNEHLLKDGEYVENGEIKSVHRPAEMFRPIWNKETHIWEESASENEIEYIFDGEITCEKLKATNSSLVVNNGYQKSTNSGSVNPNDDKFTDFFTCVDKNSVSKNIIKHSLLKDTTKCIIMRIDKKLYHCNYIHSSNEFICNDIKDSNASSINPIFNGTHKLQIQEILNEEECCKLTLTKEPSEYDGIFNVVINDSVIYSYGDMDKIKTPYIKKNSIITIATTPFNGFTINGRKYSYNFNPIHILLDKNSEILFK